MSFETNPNLPLSYVKPTIAVAIDTSAPSASNADEALKVVFYGEQQASGIAPLGTIQPLAGLNEAVSNFGTQSTITRMMRDAMAQPNVSNTVEFYGVGVAEPVSGGAAVYKIKVSVTDPTTGLPVTNPVKAGSATIYVAGSEPFSIGWGTTDTETTIGDGLVIGLNKLVYAPFHNAAGDADKWANSTGLVTGKVCFKGALFEDLPFRIVFDTANTGVFFGPGSATFGGDVKATLQPSVTVSGSVINTVLETSVGGTDVNSITLTTVAGAPSQAGSIAVIGNAITVHFKDGVTTIADFEALFAIGVACTAGTVTVKTTGTGATVLTAGNDVFGPVSFHDGTGAVGTGSVVLNTGAVTITTSGVNEIRNGDSAKQVADKFVAQLALGDYPLLAGVNVAGVVPLYFAPGKDIRRANINIGNTTGTTVLLTGGTVTDGSGNLSHAPTYAGTPGFGYPVLTTAVSNVRASGSYGKHVCPWSDNAVPVSAVFSGIVSDGDGAPAHQKGQTLTLCSTGTATAAATFITTTTPAMSSSTSPDNAGMRGAYCASPDAPQPGYILAAHVAALRAYHGGASPFTNYDNMVIAGNADVPLLVPSQMAQANWNDGPNGSPQNTAIRAGLTPLAAQDGAMAIVMGRTTISSTSNDLWDWSWIDQADTHRLEIRAQAKTTFAGCALVSTGQPRSRVDITTGAIESFLRGMLRFFENEGTYDGAEALAPLCKAQINPSQRSRADCVVPESPKIPLHTIGIVTQRTSPPSA